MEQERIKSYVLAILAALVLLAFVWLFGVEIWKVFGPGQFTFNLQEEISDPRTYVATAVAALVGGVAAVFLGADNKGSNDPRVARSISDYLKVGYVGVYISFGSLSVVAWIFAGAETSLLLRNLAVTFIGLVTPGVSAYLGVSRQGVAKREGQ